ncbi:hypothetical protein Pmani_006063 [Petrolisthes manimaculis]|uniref:CWH43-like N-terminal domain-containing protein n=1 Tax=Petrolisthes manimaculis TaxID=1843537 RepID=A0AAE1QDD6_9EUCA|nr:hypothetical protein Pmani_006063 [Petrolisthes manimaculis]
MLVSLVYMLCVIRVVRTVKHTLSPRLLRSFAQKKWLFGVKLASTGGLLFFFWRHRVFCQPMAFSWFSLCEYIIATCNMLYHVSVALDFSDEHLIVGHIVPLPPVPTNTNTTTNTPIATPTANTPSSAPHALSVLDTKKASCETTQESSPTRNGRLEDALTDGGMSVSGSHSPGAKTDGNVVVSGCMGGMVVGGGSGVGSEPDDKAAPTVVHQVLNTIHEGSEPTQTAGQPSLAQPALNSLPNSDSTLLQRRPAPPLPANTFSPPTTDAHPSTRPHIE